MILRDGVVYFEADYSGVELHGKKKLDGSAASFYSLVNRMASRLEITEGKRPSWNVNLEGNFIQVGYIFVNVEEMPWEMSCHLRCSAPEEYLEQAISDWKKFAQCLQISGGNLEGKPAADPSRDPEKDVFEARYMGGKIDFGAALRDLIADIEDQTGKRPLWIALEEEAIFGSPGVNSTLRLVLREESDSSSKRTRIFVYYPKYHWEEVAEQWYLAKERLGIKGGRKRPGEKVPDLNSKEIEILRLIRKGLTNAEIAAAMKAGSKATVASWIGDIFTKFEVAGIHFHEGKHSRQDLVTYALKLGLIDKIDFD
jgi:DNA-binding CsgD family transcriptional regulator